jgi:hypothetical protein
MKTKIIEIKIEKGIPIPDKYGKQGSEIIDMFRTLEIGDSIAFPRGKQNSVNSYARQAGIKSSTRVISDAEFRIWRTG